MTTFGRMDATRLMRLVENLLRHEPDGTRVAIGTYGPSPSGPGRPDLFHDLCLSLTVGDLRQWSRDALQDASQQEAER